MLVHGGRADYGAEVINKLARDLGAARTTLYQCSQFARYFPIVRHGGQLGWSHYRLLVQVDDEAKRLALLEQTVKHGWTSPELQERVRAFNALALEPSPSAASLGKVDWLTPERGTPGLHPVVAKAVGLSVDLGFRHYWPLTAEQAKRFAAGDIVRIAGDESLHAAEGATKSELFTYAARLVRTVDGDTLVVALELSPGVFLEQKLRLRGLDCPEMSTPEGKAAKRFVDALAAKTTAIVIHTTKPDKYDRYLADVFLTTDDGEIFLNNALLENGQAVRKDAADFGDWEPGLL